MQCPIDGTPLVITDRSGVEIDYCPQCRGVWLDRGELDKIIERASAYASPPPPPRGAPQAYDARPADVSHDASRRKKKGGFGDILGDIFDFWGLPRTCRKGVTLPPLPLDPAPLSRPTSRRSAAHFHGGL